MEKIKLVRICDSVHKKLSLFKLENDFDTLSDAVNQLLNEQDGGNSQNESNN
jgi:hypothetical protein